MYRYNFREFEFLWKTPCVSEVFIIARRVLEMDVLTYFNATIAVSDVDLFLSDLTISSISVVEHSDR